MVDTLQGYIEEKIYNPYDYQIVIQVTEDEKILIMSDSWVVLLDHNKGSFMFSGECLSYYDIDMIKDIRDSYGEIYSVYNHKKRDIEKGEMYAIRTAQERQREWEALDPKERARIKKREWDKANQAKVKATKKRWYQENKERLHQKYLEKKAEKARRNAPVCSTNAPNSRDNSSDG